MWNLKKLINKQTYRYREYFDDCQVGGALGRWGKGKGIKKDKSPVIKIVMGM